MKMTHPETDLVVDVPETAADVYRSQGWREATPAAPAGSASLEAWQTFALEQGLSEADVEGTTRDELRAALS